MANPSGKSSLKICETPNNKEKNNDGSRSQQSIGLDEEDETRGGGSTSASQPKISRMMRGEVGGR